MNKEYQTRATINERLENSELRDDSSLHEQLGAVPTDTIAPNNRPTNISMVTSKALPTVIFGLLFIAVLMILLVWFR